MGHALRALCRAGRGLLFHSAQRRRRLGGVRGSDTSRPIWTGCYWAKGQLPSQAGSPDTKLIVTDKATLQIDDSAGEVVLKNASGASTTWSSDVKTEAGVATHTVGAIGVVSEAAPGKVEVGAAGVTLNNGAFKVT